MPTNVQNRVHVAEGVHMAHSHMAHSTDMTLATIELSMKEVRAGRGRPFEEAIRQAAEELGLTLEP